MRLESIYFWADLTFLVSNFVERNNHSNNTILYEQNKPLDINSFYGTGVCCLCG